MTLRWILLGILVHRDVGSISEMATFRRGRYRLIWIRFFIPDPVDHRGRSSHPRTGPPHAPPRVACRRVRGRHCGKNGELMTTTTSRATRRRAERRRKTEDAAVVPHLSVAERVSRGKAARAEVPRSRHAVFEPSSDRPDPVTLLKRQAETRVAELVPIRYGRMLMSPFTFYRGAARIMAQDLGPTPRSGLNVQCCGDAHLSNFGVFASPERRLVFDVNDFDETLPGPWEWDVKRLAVSMLIAARDNGYRRQRRRSGS